MFFTLTPSIVLSFIALAAYAAPASNGTSTASDCPAGNGTTYTTSTGAQYLIECGIDHFQGDIASQQISSGLLTDCMAACDAQPGCVDVSMSGVACYMKGSVGPAVQSDSVRGARLISQADINSRTHTLTTAISCPSWNGSIYNSTAGSQYMVECGIDHPGSDLEMAYFNTLEQCLTECDVTPGCVTAVMSGTACYMKTSFSNAQSNSGVTGARLVSKLSPSIYAATAAGPVATAAATAKAASPTSNVQGKAFNRFVTIWLENTDYATAASDPNMAWLASQGITLSNYMALTHPSQPNYVASICGDNFGMDSDNLFYIPDNITTIIDLLEDKGISWGEYQEDQPYAGFEGKGFVNQKTQANDYVRKHNPAINFNANAENYNRLANIKNLTSFWTDLANNALPQWMFITPNMTSDGHDTSVTTAGQWTRNFLAPLLNNPSFMSNTLVLVTFDENHNYAIQNRVFSILLGDAVPASLIGTTDSNYYNHYSEISTVEANWGLDTLGRWDVGANVFSLVANQTGDSVRSWPAVTAGNSTIMFNSSFTGFLSAAKYVPRVPGPLTDTTYAGRSVYRKVSNLYRNAGLPTYYTTDVQIPDGNRPPTGW